MCCWIQPCLKADIPEISQLHEFHSDTPCSEGVCLWFTIKNPDEQSPHPQELLISPSAYAQTCLLRLQATCLRFWSEGQAWPCYSEREEEKSQLSQVSMPPPSPQRHNLHAHTAGRPSPPSLRKLWMEEPRLPLPRPRPLPCSPLLTLQRSEIIEIFYKILCCKVCHYNENTQI